MFKNIERTKRFLAIVLSITIIASITTVALGAQDENGEDPDIAGIGAEALSLEVVEKIVESHDDASDIASVYPEQGFEKEMEEEDSISTESEENDESQPEPPSTEDISEEVEEDSDAVREDDENSDVAQEDDESSDTAKEEDENTDITQEDDETLSVAQENDETPNVMEEDSATNQKQTRSGSYLTVDSLEIIASSKIVTVGTIPDWMDGVRVRVHFTDGTWKYGVIGEDVTLTYAVPGDFSTDVSPAQFHIRYDASLSDKHEWNSPDDRATQILRLATIIDPYAEMGANIINIRGIDNFDLGGNEGRQYEIELLYTPLEHQHDKGRYVRLLLPDFVGFEYSVIPPQISVPFEITQISQTELIIKFEDGPIAGESLIPISFIHRGTREFSKTPIPPSFEIVAHSYRGLDAPPDENTDESYLHATDAWELIAPQHPVSTLFAHSFSPTNAQAVINSFSTVSGAGENSQTLTANNIKKPAAMRSTQDDALRLLVPVPDGLDEIGVTPIATGTTTIIEIDGEKYWQGPIWTPGTNPSAQAEAFKQALWSPPLLNTTPTTASLTVTPRYRGITTEIIQNPRTFTSERPILISLMQGGEINYAPLLNLENEKQNYSITFGRLGVADFDIQAFNRHSIVLPEISSRPFRVQGTHDAFPGGGTSSTVEFRPTRYTNTTTRPQAIYEDMFISLGPFVPEMQPHGISMNPRYGEALFEYTLHDGTTKWSQEPLLRYQFDVGDSFVRSIRIHPVKIDVQDQGVPIVEPLQLTASNHYTWVFRLSSKYLREDALTGDLLKNVHPANFDITIESEQQGLFRPTRSQNFDLRVYNEVLRYDSAMLSAFDTANREGWQGVEDNQIHFWPRIYDMVSSRNNMFEDVNLRFTISPAVFVRGIWLRSGATNETNNITIHFSDGSNESHQITKSTTQAGALMPNVSPDRYITRIDWSGIDIRDNNNVDGFPAWSITNPHFTLIADYSEDVDLAKKDMQPRHDSHFGLRSYLDGLSTPHNPPAPVRGAVSNLALWLNSWSESDFAIRPSDTHHYVYPEENRHTGSFIFVASLDQVRPASARGIISDNNATLLPMSEVEFVLNAQTTSQEFLKSLNGFSRNSNLSTTGLPVSSVITAHYTLSSGVTKSASLTTTSLAVSAFQYDNPSEYITELRITITNVPERSWNANTITTSDLLNRFPLVNFQMNLHRYRESNNGIDFEHIGVTEPLAPVFGAVRSVSTQAEILRDIEGSAGHFIVPWGNDIYVAALGLNHTISRVGENPIAADLNRVIGGYNNPSTIMGAQTNTVNNPGFWPGQTLQVDVRNILAAAYDREGHDTRDPAVVRADSLPRGFAIRSINTGGQPQRSWVGTATSNDLTNVVVYIPVEPGFSFVEDTMQLMRGETIRDGAVRSVSTIPSPEGTWLRVELNSYRPAGLRNPGTVEFLNGDVRNLSLNTPGTGSRGGTANFIGGDTLRFELRASDFIPWDTTGSRPVIRGQYYIDVTNTGYTGDAELRFYDSDGMRDNDGVRFVSGWLSTQNTPPASMIPRNIGPAGSGSRVLENSNPVTLRYSGAQQPTASDQLKHTPYHFPNTALRLGNLHVRINAPSQQIGIFGLSTVGGDALTEAPNNNARYYNHEDVGVTVRASHVATIGNPTADYAIFAEIPRVGWGNLTHPGLKLSGPITTLELPPNDSSIFEYTVTTDRNTAHSDDADENIWLSEDELLSNFSWSDVTMVRIRVSGVGNLPFMYNIPMKNIADKSFVGNQEIQVPIYFRSPQIEDNALRTVQVLPTFTLTDYTVSGHLWLDEKFVGVMTENDAKIVGSARVLYPTGFVSAWSPATVEEGFSVKIPAFNPGDGTLGPYRIEVAAPGYEPIYVDIEDTDDSRFTDKGDGTGYRDVRISETHTVINAGFKESQKVSIVYLNEDGSNHVFDVAEIGDTINAPEELPRQPGLYYRFTGWKQSDSLGEPISTHLWVDEFELSETYLVAPIAPRDTVYFVAVWAFDPPLAFSAPEFLDFGTITPQFGTTFIELPDLPSNGSRPAQIPDTNVNFQVTAGEHLSNWRIDVRHDAPLNLRHRDHTESVPKFIDRDALVFFAGSGSIFGNSQRVYAYKGNDAGWDNGVYTINWMELENRLRIRTTSPLIEIDTAETVRTPITWIFIPEAP